MLLGVDVGGTFTDAVLVGDDAAIHTAKVPSTPGEQSVAVLEAVGLVLERAGAQPQQVERFAHGMTVATSALRCAAPERTGPDGPLRPLDPAAARSLVQLLADARPEAIAVALLHSYADPSHERMLGALIAELLPETHLSLSCDLVGTFREYERTATTVLDAALSPLLEAYLSRLSIDARALGLCEPQIMQSSGGLTDPDRAGAHAALTILSGPAGAVRVGEAAGG